MPIYNIKDILYIGNSIVVNDISNIKLEKDLYVSVTRSNNIVKYNLSSRKMDVVEYINDAIKIYDRNTTVYKITLTGIENGIMYKYPESMLCLTYILINVYGMTKLRILNGSEQEKGIYDVSIVENDTSKKILSDISKNINSLFLIEEYKDFKLKDDIFINIEKNAEHVIYTLTSNTHDLKNFIKECLETYKQLINKTTYKYTTSLIGYETYGQETFKLKYPVGVNALNYYLLEICKISNIKTYEVDGKSIHVVNDSSNLNINGVVFMISRYCKKDTILYNGGESSNTKVTYDISSNEVNVLEFLEKVTEDYKNFLKNQNKNKIYHFIYNGKDKGFTTNILSEPGNELFESFDNIHNEHSESLKKDMIRLNNKEYYEQTGLRRKKGYLFYGAPGCGKTSSVVALALSEKRHLIELQFNTLTENSELESILNKKSIDGVTFTKSEVIFLLDEIDIGMTKIKNADEKDEFVTVTIEKEKDKKVVTKEEKQKLNLGTILSRLDGVGNYSGMIMIATTNNKDSLPESLYRELRLTPYHFTYLRREDAVIIIEKFFKIKLSVEKKEKLPDRKISPAKLRHLCEKYESCNMEEFIDIVNKLI